MKATMFGRKLTPVTCMVSGTMLVLCIQPWASQGLIAPSPRFMHLSSVPNQLALLHPSVPTTTYHPGTRLYKELEDQKKGFFESIFDPVPTKIPPEMKDEIYRAEANTAAAKERANRIAVYVVLAIFLVLCACFNAFLTELRDTIDPSTVSRYNELVPETEAITKEISLQDFGFDWVNSNFLFRFLFISRIGGAISLVSGAIFGLLVEAELDAKRVNAEKIWEEIVRRRSGGTSRGKTKLKPQAAPRPKSKKRSKGRKRLDALSEVLIEESTVVEEPSADDIAEKVAEEEQLQKEEKKNDGGIVGKMKEFYDKADSMAASQALMLNKELEDRGVVDKITDETGLKVIGREAAAKLEEEKYREDKTHSE